MSTFVRSLNRKKRPIRRGDGSLPRSRFYLGSRITLLPTEEGTVAPLKTTGVRGWGTGVKRSAVNQKFTLSGEHNVD